MSLIGALAASALGALVPTGIYVWALRRMDPYEKEPFFLLALAFAWGAVPAVVLSLVAELALGIPLSVLDPQASAVVAVGITGPLVEEMAKGVTLVFLSLALRSEFDSVLDGVVYGGMIGLGFAMTENFVYFLAGFGSGIATGFTLLATRTVLFGLNHAFFTAILGGALGFARMAPRRSVRWVAPLAGLALAVGFHSIHNLGVSLVESTCLFSFLASIISDGMGMILVLAIVALAWRQERHWIVEELQEEVRRGLLEPDEVTVIASAARRFTRLTRARQQEGWAASRRLGNYYQTATELAFKKRQRRARGSDRDVQAQIGRLRADLEALRSGLPELGS